MYPRKVLTSVPVAIEICCAVDTHTRRLAYGPVVAAERLTVAVAATLNVPPTTNRNTPVPLIVALASNVRPSQKTYRPGLKTTAPVIDTAVGYSTTADGSLLSPTGLGLVPAPQLLAGGTVPRNGSAMSLSARLVPDCCSNVPVVLIGLASQFDPATTSPNTVTCLASATVRFGQGVVPSAALRARSGTADALAGVAWLCWSVRNEALRVYANGVCASVPVSANATEEVSVPHAGSGAQVAVAEVIAWPSTRSDAMAPLGQNRRVR